MPKDDFPYYYDSNLSKEENLSINQEIIQYAGMYVLKEMEIAQESQEEDSGNSYTDYEDTNNHKNPGYAGYARKSQGHRFEVPLSTKDEVLEPVLDSLLFSDRVHISPEKACYELTQEGRDYIDQIIEELESYMDRYEDLDSDRRVQSMRRDRVDPLRARFLWGLCDGEFDDLVLWQQERGISPVVSEWQNWLVSKNFYDELVGDFLQDPDQLQN